MRNFGGEMAEVRGDKWLPYGWKVEVRVRKSGRKDRYYKDPASGYVFRSLRDIDRYLLTGKFGRRAMKSKNNGFAGASDSTLDGDDAPVEAVQKQSSGRNGKKKPASGGINSNQKPKNRKISSTKSADDFSIPDGGLPNCPEIIDSMTKSEHNENATYLSAPEIAVLLGRQTAPSPCLAEEIRCTANETDKALDLSLDVICSDPCIEFAIKTLTGAIPLESFGLS